MARQPGRRETRKTYLVLGDGQTEQLLYVWQGTCEVIPKEKPI